MVFCLTLLSKPCLGCILFLYIYPLFFLSLLLHFNESDIEASYEPMHTYDAHAHTFECVHGHMHPALHNLKTYLKKRILCDAKHF